MTLTKLDPVCGSGNLRREVWPVSAGLSLTLSPFTIQTPSAVTTLTFVPLLLWRHPDRCRPARPPLLSQEIQATLAKRRESAAESAEEAAGGGPTRRAPADAHSGLSAALSNLIVMAGFVLFAGVVHYVVTQDL